MTILRVIQPGPYTTIQDLGRFGYQDLGVPVSGSLDALASRMANRLVGNEAACAVLEITFAGPELEVLAPTEIAVTGADMALTCNGRSVPQWASWEVAAGDRLRFGQALSGCRTYLAVRGGLDVPPVMGSRSTYNSAQMGGLQGRPLQAGDVLAADHTPRQGGPGRLLWRPCYRSAIRLRVLPGPQERYFSQALEVFFNNTYTVTPHINRMGCRLQGPKLERNPDAPASIISEPSMPGNIQVPADGQPIVLMMEQTIGGYAKIATVITADIFKLAQARPEDQVRFFPVSLEEAHVAYRQWWDVLNPAEN